MKRGVRALLSLSFTLLLLYLFLRGVDLEGVWRETRSARPAWLAVCLAGAVLHYSLRAARWRTLLSPAGRPVSFRLALSCTLIGYFLSAVLPGRPGELVRPVLLAARSGIRRSFALATILIERAILDPLTLLALLIVALLIRGRAGDISPASHHLRQRVWASSGLAASLVAILLLGAIWALTRRQRLIGWLRRLARSGPRRGRIVDAVERFAEALAVLGSSGVWPRAILGSLLTWSAVALGLWGGVCAFQADIGYLDALVLSAMAAVGVAVPTPGGVGGFHLAVQIGLTTLYGVPAERAVPAALFTHLLLLLPALVLGSVLAWREGLDISSLWNRGGQWDPGRQG